MHSMKALIVPAYPFARFELAWACIWHDGGRHASRSRGVRNLLQVSQFALNGYHVLIVLLHAVTQAFNPVQITRHLSRRSPGASRSPRASCRRASAAFLRSPLISSCNT